MSLLHGDVSALATAQELRLTPEMQFLAPSPQKVDDAVACGFPGQLIL